MKLTREFLQAAGQFSDELIAICNRNHIVRNTLMLNFQKGGDLTTGLAACVVAMDDYTERTQRVMVRLANGEKFADAMNAEIPVSLVPPDPPAPSLPGEPSPASQDR